MTAPSPRQIVATVVCCGGVVCTLWIIAAAKPARLPNVLDLAPGARKPQEPLATFTLDAAHPEEFLRTHLRRAMEVPKPGGLSAHAIEQSAILSIKGDRDVGEMDLALIDGVQVNPESYYVHFIGVPLVFDEAHALARRICQVVGIPTDRIVEWFDSGSYRNESGSTCLQVGRTPDGVKHSIEIRNAVLADDPHRWSVSYNVSFDLSKPMIPAREIEFPSREVQVGPERPDK